MDTTMMAAKAAATGQPDDSAVAGWRRPSLYHDWYRILATQERYDVLFIVGLLVCELLLGGAIIARVSYTEIDWQAYMEEVDTYEAGERDYTMIRGGTGPLVYPAGFLYLFAALKAWTGQGTDVRRAQHIFLAFYLATQVFVLAIYQQCLRASRKKDQQPRSVPEVWSWRLAMACLCLSKRLHSIFLLRLFNDGPTMLLLYISLYLFNKNRWNTGCLFFSLAVSIKMNVLLFAPGLLLLLLQTSRRYSDVVLRLGLCCALPQLLLGAPFLLTYPISYLRKAFELDRVFFYKWTVNWKVMCQCVHAKTKSGGSSSSSSSTSSTSSSSFSPPRQFLSEDTFTSKPLSVLLLTLHVMILLYLFVYRVSATSLLHGRPLHPVYITRTMLLSNFVGICFARTLHYQFYAWYFHALPLLLWSASSSSSSSSSQSPSSPTTRTTTRQSMIPIPVRLVCLAAIEMSFLTFPATPLSSGILQLVHLFILGASVVSGASTDDGEMFLLEDGTTAASQYRIKHHKQ